MKVVAYDPTWRAATLAWRREMYPDNPLAGEEAFFHWRHERHPFGAPLMLLAVEGDEVIGHWLGIPERLHTPLGVVELSWLVDLAVDPARRDTMAAMQLFKAVSAQGGPVMAIGVPETLLPFYSVFRWHRMAVADTFFRVFQPDATSRLAGRSLPLPSLGPLADRALPLCWRLRGLRRTSRGVQAEAEAGPEFDRLFADLAPRLGRCGDRGSAWLRWKLFDRPHGHHELLVARDGRGALLGWIAVKLRERRGQVRWAEVVDFLCDPADGPLFDHLVEAASDRALQAGVAFLRLRCALPEHTARLTEPLWIRQVRAPIDDLFVLPGRDPQIRAALLGHPWHLGAGGSDTVDTGLDEWPAAPPP